MDSSVNHTLLITLITFLHQSVREPHGPSITHSVDFFRGSNRTVKLYEVKVTDE
jgi:hypothetical protein